MVNHGNGIILERLHVCQCLCSHSFTRKVGQTEVVVFQQFHKVGGGAGLEPVAAELQGTERIQQAEGVIQIGSVLTEAVAVVPFFQSQADFVVGDTVVFGYLVQRFFKIGVYLLVGHSAERLELSVHGEVYQVVQVAEHTDLSEFRHPRQESETDIPVLRLHYGVEGFERVAIFILQFFVTNGLEHGFVVFVHEDDHALAGLLVGAADDSLETQFGVDFAGDGSVDVFPLAESIVQYVDKTVLLIVFTRVQIQMQYRIFRPFFFEPFHFQSLEQFLLPVEVGFQCADEQTLSESPRAAQEVVTTGMY